MWEVEGGRARKSNLEYRTDARPRRTSNRECPVRRFVALGVPQRGMAGRRTVAGRQAGGIQSQRHSNSLQGPPNTDVINRRLCRTSAIKKQCVSIGKRSREKIYLSYSLTIEIEFSISIVIRLVQVMADHFVRYFVVCAKLVSVRCSV